MAHIPPKPRILKDGTQVYDIQIYINDADQKLHYRTYTREKGISENEHKRRVNAFVVNCENEIRNQIITQKQAVVRKNEMITFKEHSNDWLKRSEQKDSKTSVNRNTKVVQELNNFLGNMPLKLIQPRDITPILDYLNNKKIITETAILKKSIDEIIKKTNVDKLCCENNFSTASVFYAKKGNRIQWEYAVRLCKALGLNVNEYFTKTRTEKPYSKGSKLVYRKVLNAIFNYAVEFDLMEKNPAKKALKIEYLSGEIKEKDILTLEETTKLQTILKTITNEVDLKRKTVVAMFLSLGIRQGELVGLQWKDIDFDKKRVYIRRSSTYAGARFGVVTKVPKTKSSIRELPIPTNLMEVLLEYKEWYDSEYQKLYEIWDKEMWVFVKPTGEQLFPATTKLWLDYVLAKGGIRHVGCHSLRHTFITTLLREKQPVKVVAKLAGHANPNVTLATYAHFLEEDNDKAAEVMNKLLG